MSYHAGKTLNRIQEKINPHKCSMEFVTDILWQVGKMNSMRHKFIIGNKSILLITKKQDETRIDCPVIPVVYFACLCSKESTGEIRNKTFENSLR